MEPAKSQRVDIIPGYQHVEKQVVWVSPQERVMIILVGLVGSGKAGISRIQDTGYLHLTYPFVVHICECPSIPLRLRPLQPRRNGRPTPQGRGQVSPVTRARTERDN